MESWKYDRIGSAERGENPTVIVSKRWNKHRHEK